MSSKKNKQMWLYISIITFFSTFIYINFTFSKNSYLNKKNLDINKTYELYMDNDHEVNNLFIEKVITTAQNKSAFLDNLKSIKNFDFKYLESKGFSNFGFYNLEGTLLSENFSEVQTKLNIDLKEKKGSYWGINLNNSEKKVDFIYPLFFDKEVVALFRFSTSTLHLTSKLNKYFQANFAFYDSNSLVNNNDLNLGNSLKYKIDTQKSFFFTKINLLEKDRIYSFLPVKDINNKFTGYLVSIENNNELKKIVANQIVIFLFISLLFFVAIVIYKHLQKKHNEDKKLLEQYKYIIDKSTIVSKTDAKGIITYVNPQFCKISGYKQEELIGNSHNIIRHPKSTVPFFRQMWKTISSKKIWQGVIRNRAKNGKDYYVKSTIAPILNEKDEIIEFMALREDITDLINKKDMFKLEKEKMTSLFNHIDEILLIKRDNIFEQISNKFFEVLDYSSLHEFNSKHHNLSELFIKKDGYNTYKNDDELIRELANNKEVNKVLIQDKNNEFKTFWIRVQKVPFSKSFYYLFILIDISALENNQTKIKEENLIDIKEEEDLFQKAKKELALPDEILYSLVEKFIESTLTGIESFKTAINNEDYNEAKIIAHNIKGSSSTLRLDKISNLAMDIENNIKTNPKEQLEKMEEIKILINNIKLNKENK
ncbi:PAS domain S-box protein [Arcobacter sp. YIC-464]|uniref:PAS domain S-box protein n=1 Tax=Arcobacter sp. YIC-464 TaxID=3376631 RepID=UPI003C1E3488